MLVNLQDVAPPAADGAAEPRVDSDACSVAMSGHFRLKLRQTLPMVVQLSADRFEVTMLNCCVWHL